MKKCIFFFVLFSIFIGSGTSLASHIVGGEFELLHIEGFQYRLNMILYFDEIHGNEGAKDDDVTVYIYSKNGRRFITSFVLNRVKETNVVYTQPACSYGGLQTSKIIYSRVITLSEEIYSDPEGYYITWERCCRNYAITNIISEDPGTNSEKFAGFTLYLEFPPVVMNGERFIDSTPRLFPPLSDYACPGKYYYVDFSGTDDDGDSLVYSMVTPLSTKTGDAIPEIPFEGPYPDVVWENGYSLNRITGGDPDLSISTTGLLTLTAPEQAGLYVFGIKVEQFRNNQKLGETRRDFQMLVKDRCADAVPPIIESKGINEVNFVNRERLDITMRAGAPKEDRCFSVKVYDADSFNPKDNNLENVRIRVKGINFSSPDLNEVLPESVTAQLSNGSTAEFQICLPECPFISDVPYEFAVIAQDDACALPLLDSLFVRVNVTKPLNNPPFFGEPVNVTATLNEGDSREWIFEVFDQTDSIDLEVIPDGFKLADAGMSYEILEERVGYLRGKFVWDAYCELYSFAKQTNFDVTFSANDKDICDFNDPVEAQYDLTVKLPFNNFPVVDTDITADLEETVVEISGKIFETFTFNVTGRDDDMDKIFLKAIGEGFTLKSVNMNFDPAEGDGAVTSKFTWTPQCTDVNLDNKNEYVVPFVVTDNLNKCRIEQTDTMRVNIKLAPPDNQQPKISLNWDAQKVRLVDNEVLHFITGDPVEIHVSGIDFDKPEDLLTLALESATGDIRPVGFKFKETQGRGKVNSTLTWTPDCSIYDVDNKIFDREFKFVFKLFDDRCFNNMSDADSVVVKISDPGHDDIVFQPPNVITPNGDGCNDYFAFEALDAEACGNRNFDINFPIDNCLHQFKTVKVLNRWGKQVFESSDRNFRWYPGSDVASGVYFFHISFTDATYKGTIDVRP